MGPHYYDDQPSSPHVDRLRWARRGLLTAVVLAGLVAGCGTSSTQNTEAADPGDAQNVTLAAGSDQHLENQAAEIARRERFDQAATARLEGQAKAYAEASAPTIGSDRHLVNLAREAARDTSATIGSDRHLVELARQAEQR